MKLKAITAALLAAAMLTACGGSAASSASAAEQTGDLLDQIRARGEIIIATEGTWSPWTFHDEKDQLVGFDIEVA